MTNTKPKGTMFQVIMGLYPMSYYLDIATEKGKEIYAYFPLTCKSEKDLIRKLTTEYLDYAYENGIMKRFKVESGQDFLDRFSYDDLDMVIETRTPEGRRYSILYNPIEEKRFNWKDFLKYWR